MYQIKECLVYNKLSTGEIGKFLDEWQLSNGSYCKQTKAKCLTKQILVNSRLSNNKLGQYLDEWPLSKYRYSKQPKLCFVNNMLSSNIPGQYLEGWQPMAMGQTK